MLPVAEQPTAADEPAPPPADGIEAALEKQLRQLGSMQNAIEAALSGGTATPALAREAAAVSRALVSLSAEHRARRKEVGRAAAKVTPQQRLANVLLYLEHYMPAGKRKVVRALLDRLDGDGGLLS